MRWSAKYEITRSFIPTGEIRKNGQPVMRPVNRRAFILKDEILGTVVRFPVNKVKGRWRVHDPRHKNSGLKGSGSLTPLEFIDAVKNMIGVDRAAALLAGVS